MDKKFQNRIVSLDNIIYIADIMQKHDIVYKEMAKQELQKVEDAKARDEHYYKKYVLYRIKFSITFNNNEVVTKTYTDEDDSSKNEVMNWFKETLKLNAKIISSVYLTFYASTEINQQRESTSITFYKNRIDMDCSADNMAYNALAEQIEQYINGLPPRYDDTVVKDNRRTMLPALAISIPIGLIVALALLIVSKIGVLPSGVAVVLNNGFLLTGAFLLIAFLGALIIPTENTSLYKHFKFDTYYAGYDDKNYKSIYKNDYEDFKRKCEVEIGENVEMPIVRQKINDNYKKAIKIVKIEAIISIIGIVLFFVL